MTVPQAMIASEVDEAQHTVTAGRVLERFMVSSSKDRTPVTGV